MTDNRRAPKDAMVKREGFYIIKNSGIQATEFSDGRRKEFYINEDRLISAAKIVGNVKDENILKLLKTAEGFCSLVHSIGFTITAKEQKSIFRTTMIMYGRKNLYGGGTHASIEVAANGVEQVMVLQEIDWSEDDDVLGQFAFSFPQGVEFAEVSVKLYLNDGYNAPIEEDEPPVRLSGGGYRRLVEKSLVQTGNNARLKIAISKARAGVDVTMAFIGGSITQGAGAFPIATECYAYKTFCAFTKKYAKDASKMHYIKAGVGGTSSELGVLRYDHDVTCNGQIDPDIVVIEFAVNDAGDETEGDCYESLIRKIWNSKAKPAILLLFSVFADDYNLQERFLPIGRACKLPMISMKDALVEQFNLSISEGRVVSRRQYFYDLFHPSNTGHSIMADCLIRCIDIMNRKMTDERFENLPVVRSSDFEEVVFFDRTNIEAYTVNYDQGDFDKKDDQLQAVERNMDSKLTPMFPNNWMHNETAPGNRPFTFQIDCRVLLLVMKDTGDVNFGKAKVFVDGRLTRIFDPLEIGWTHSNALIVFREKEAACHEIKIVMEEGCIDKRFTILGFGRA